MGAAQQQEGEDIKRSAAAAVAGGHIGGAGRRAEGQGIKGGRSGEAGACTRKESSSNRYSTK